MNIAKVKQKKKTKVNSYTLIDYYDVWGNAEDGYEVNDSMIAFTDLNISEDATDEDIIDYLISINYLAPQAKEECELENNGEWMEITRKADNYPVCSLRLNIV